MKVYVEKVNERCYVVGNTFALKDKLKEAGFRWDTNKKAWWTLDESLATSFESNSEEAEEQPARTVEDRSSAICTGKVQYKGKTYYIIGHSSDGQKFNVTPLNCQIDFWIDRDNCTVTKEYKSRVFQGRKSHQTVGSIREFVAGLKANGTESDYVRQDYNPADESPTPHSVVSTTTLPWQKVCCCYCGELTFKSRDWCLNCRKAGYE